MNREHGDDMRRLLRRADPAASLAPVGDDRITRLAEDAMNTDTTTPKIPAAQPAPSPRPGPLRWVFVGAGALAAGAAAAFVLPALLAPPTVTTLQLSDADPLTQMCAQITPEIVASGDLAFRADVESIEGGVVTLRVTERFQGEVGDFVRVEQGDDEPIDGAPNRVPRGRDLSREHERRDDRQLRRVRHRDAGARGDLRRGVPRLTRGCPLPDRGPAYLSRRLSTRSASGFPPVWQVGQYWNVESE